MSVTLTIIAAVWPVCRISWCIGVIKRQQRLRRIIIASFHCNHVSWSSDLVYEHLIFVLLLSTTAPDQCSTRCLCKASNQLIISLRIFEESWRPTLLLEAVKLLRSGHQNLEYHLCSIVGVFLSECLLLVCQQIWLWQTKHSWALLNLPLPLSVCNFFRDWSNVWLQRWTE